MLSEFRPLSEKNINAVQFKLCVYTYWVSVQNWFVLGHLMAQKWLELIQLLSEKVFTIHFMRNVYTCWVSVHNWFVFKPHWPNFGPLVAKQLMKLGENGRFRWCVHLLCECSELILFWATLTNVGPLVATKWLKMVVSDHNLKKVSLCGIMITRSISNMVFTLVRGRDLHKWLNFLPHGPNLAPLVAISVFPFPLIGPQAGMCILWCLVLSMILRIFDFIVWS